MMMKASAMTTKMVVASIIAIIKQCRYYNRTGYKNVVDLPNVAFAESGILYDE